MKKKEHTTAAIRTIQQISEFTDHALANICCSGNKEWSEAAQKELNKRKPVA